MKLKLIEKQAEVLNVNSFLFAAQEPIIWKAGQYMRYHLEDPQPDERKFDRFFTIASAPFEGNLRLTTRFVPDDGSTFKKDLQSLKPGDSIEASGPMGAFTVDDPLLEYVFIAGGIGITPYRAILKDLDFKGKPINVTLLYANRDQDVVYKDELEDLVRKHPGFKIHYIFSPQRIDETVTLEAVSDIQKPLYYLSGPKPMVESFVPMLEGMKVSRDKIKTDFFPGYKGI